MLDILKFVMSADNQMSAAFSAVKRDLKDVKGALATVEDHARRAGKAMRSIGLKASATVTAPLTLLGQQSLRLFDQQAQAEAAVTQALNSTAGAAGRTADELFRAASGMQAITKFGDEDILRNVTGPLLTFTNVSEGVFDRAQMAVLDMSTLLKTDLKSAALQVGKALNDPVKGLSTLRRVGIDFSSEQKETIKTLVEMGDVARAQGLILDELKTKFGGQAAAAAKVGLGPMEQLKNAIGDVKEQLGEQIASFLPAVVKHVSQAVAWFSKLDPAVKKNIVIFGGLAAAVGPVIGVLGLLTLGVTSLIGPLAGLIGLLVANPIGAAVAAIAAGAVLIYRNWDGISGWFSARWDAVKAVTSRAWGAIKAVLMNHTAAGLIYRNWDGISGWFSARWDAVEAVTSRAWGAIRNLMAGPYAPAQLIYRNWQGIGDWFSALTPQITDAFANIWDAIRTEVAEWPSRMLQLGGDLIDGLILGIRDRAGAAVRSVRDAVSSMIGGAKDEAQVKSPSRVFAAIGEDLMRGLGLGISRAADTPIDEVKRLARELGVVARQAPDLDRMFGQSFSSILRGAESARDAVGRLADRLADMVLTNAATSIFGQIGVGTFLAPALGFAQGGAINGGRVVPFASGAALDMGRVKPFAAGGVVSSPVAFPMRGGTGLMGESGPEGILPLARARNGDLGVRAIGGGNATEPQAVAVDVRVFVDDDAKLRAVIERHSGAVSRSEIAQAAPQIVSAAVGRVRHLNGRSKRPMNIG